MAKKHSVAAKRAEMRAQPEEDPEFQIAPMIDILLVLLVFFMSISTTEVLQKSDVQLPVAKDAKDKDKNVTGQAIVNVIWNEINNAGSIEMEGNRFAVPADIVPILQKRINETPTLRILVRADKRTRYEYTKLLLKAVGLAGGSNITFSVVDKEAAGAPAAATP